MTATHVFMKNDVRSGRSVLKKFWDGETESCLLQRIRSTALGFIRSTVPRISFSSNERHNGPAPEQPSASAPPGATLPRRLGQFPRSFPARPRWVPRVSGEVSDCPLSADFIEEYCRTGSSIG